MDADFGWLCHIPKAYYILCHCVSGTLLGLVELEVGGAFVLWPLTFSLGC